MKVLLDINVMLDLSLRRAPWHVEADAIWNAASLGRVQILVASSSLSTVHYLVGKQLGRDQALKAVEGWARGATILPVDRATVLMALIEPSGDYEDNVQNGCALLCEAEAIVTRDRTGFTRALLPVYTPAELLSLIPPPAPIEP